MVWRRSTTRILIMPSSRGQDSEPHRFRVREIKSVEKTRFSTIVEDVFRPDSPYRLTLITCGGAFDEAEGSYLSNIIVTAYPER